MTPDELQDLARAMEKVPGLKGIDLRDVRRLAQLLHDHPEIGAIELKGFFGTGVVISRTAHGQPMPMPAPMAWPAAAPAAVPAPAALPPAGADAAPAAAPSSLK